MMTSTDLHAMLPLIVVAGGTLVVMLAVAVRRHHATAAALTMFTLAVAFATVFPGTDYAAASETQLGALIVIDGFGRYIMALLLAGAFLVTGFAYGYLERQDGRAEDFYLLLLPATLGSMVLAVASHFATLFLGLEILSIPLYAMIAWKRRERHALEAGIKYLVLAAMSSAFLLFGMALVYARLGVMDFLTIATRAAALGWSDPVMLGGFALMITGFGFKLAVVPFHMWTPDVYQGAPAPVTAFIAAVSKGGMFALLLRVYLESGLHQSPAAVVILTAVAIASMLAGNLLALLQQNVKRILAYSSIAHLGYLLVALIAGAGLAVEAAAFYLTAYVITILGAFGVVTLLSGTEAEAEDIADYRGLFWRRPWLALALTAMLFSLAGMPLTAGFIGKFEVAAAGVQAGLWLLLASLVVGSVISVYYYLRIIVAMFTREEESDRRAMALLSGGGSVALAVLLIALIWLGVFPAGLTETIRTLVSGFGG